MFGDSSMIVNQATSVWKVKSESLALYQQHLSKLAEKFNHIEFKYLPRGYNELADALAKLSSMVAMPEKDKP